MLVRMRTEVAESSSGALGGGVAVLDAGHGEQLLGHGGGDDASSPGCGDEHHQDGAALAGDLAGHGVGLADLVAPEATPHGHDRLEARALTGTGLLLDGHDLQHLVLQRRTQEVVDDLELLEERGQLEICEVDYHNSNSRNAKIRTQVDFSYFSEDRRVTLSSFSTCAAEGFQC